jgi:CRP-like cAMP-binding protein
MAEDRTSADAESRLFEGVEPACMICPTSQQAEWHALDRDGLRTLNESKTCANYKPGQIIFQQNSPCLGLFCILEGSVALRQTDAQGNTSIVRMIEAGQTMGHRSYFAGTAHSSSAEALGACRVCFIPRKVVDGLMESPELGARFLQRLAGELGKAEEGQFRSTHQRIRTRLAYLILSLKGAHGEVDDEGNILIESPLSRQDMAAVIGARPESLSRAIRALQDDGVVVFNRRCIIIEDLDNLLDEIDHHI